MVKAGKAAGSPDTGPIGRLLVPLGDLFFEEGPGRSNPEPQVFCQDKAPGCKIMVGGAALTQEYAGMIGADFYGPDAMASVRYAMGLAEQLS